MPTKLNEPYQSFALHRMENALIFGREPAMILSFIQVVLVMAVTFGLDFSEAETAAILSVAAVGIGLWTRTNVMPVAHEKLPSPR